MTALISLSFRILRILLMAACSAGCRPDAVELKPQSETSEIRKSEVGRGIPLDRLRNVANGIAGPATRQSVLFASLPKDRLPAFVYDNGSRGHHLMVEATGGGCAWLDLEHDGQMDLYLVQGGIPDEQPGVNTPIDRVWRQVSGRFQDATESTGIHETNYGQGVAVGDFDNDGFDDIFVTNIGGNALFQSRGDGTFQAMNLDGQSSRVWSTSAGWGDIDLDGDLDLYVCNYVDFDPFHPQVCVNADGVQIQCGPSQVAPVADEFYRNEGDGVFKPVAETLGLKGVGNRALGVVIADFTGDHTPEIYVANDATANFMFSRDTDGQYADIASRLGCALDANGLAQASMGIAPGDFNGDGLLDLYLTHFEGEWNTLYQNTGEFGFRDVTSEFQIVQPTIPWVGFGTVMEDFDQDGFSDIFVVNGHIDDLGRKRVLEMPPQLFSFDGQAFRDVSAEAGDYFQSRSVGRGCSQSDFDNDGDFDIAVIHHGRPAGILVNESQRGHWLAVEMVGTVSNRRGIGAKLVVRQNDLTLTQQLCGGGSYCSSRQPRLIFGLGESTAPCQVEVRWPNGRTQQLKNVAIDDSIVITEARDND